MVDNGVVDLENLDGSEGPNSDSVSGGKVSDENPTKKMLDRIRDEEDQTVHIQKKKKIGGNYLDGNLGNFDSDMKRVAEIVLVLSAMGQMRGGRSPTAVERALTDEARDKLASLCELLPPQYLLTKDAVGVLVEDLGLNRSNDQRMETRPKTSIAEKLSLAMKKIEESRESATLSATYSSQMPSFGFTTSAGSHGGFFHGVHKFSPGKPSPVTPYHATQVSTLASASTSQSNEVQPATVFKPLERDSLLFALPAPQVHFKLDKLPEGSAHLQARANSAGDHIHDEGPTSSAHSSSVSLDSSGHENKAEGTHGVNAFQFYSQATTDPKAKAFAVQTAHQPMQVMKSGETPMVHMNHADIVRNVQKFLQVNSSDHPNWIQPSIAYMNAPLVCQICKVTISDVESLLVCDACEKGVHLKCLQSYSQKGVPKGEWHCPKCLIASNGKPLPPKYGRVGRSVSAPKVNTGGIRTSPEKRVEILDRKVNSQKVVVNGVPDFANPHRGSSIGSAHNDLGPLQKMPNIREMQAPSLSGSGPKTDDGSCQKSSMDSSSKERADPIAVLSCSSELTANHHDQNNYVDVPNENNGHTLEVSKRSSGSEDISEYVSKGDGNREDRVVGQVCPSVTLDCGNGSADCRSSMEDLHSVDWVGDIVQVIDEKAYYQSCCINGVVYKLQDHALFRSDDHNLSPYIAKLKVLWEDNKTRSKWVTVKRCYFPNDLPEVVGRPCTPEKNEVYESNHENVTMVGLIQGLCQVLSTDRFKEESERRNLSSHSESRSLHPVFLCKWFFDEPKGIFRPVTD